MTAYRQRQFMMKAWFIKFHKWLGLALGIFWLLQVISGSLLVFHRELDDLLLASEEYIHSKATLDLDTALLAVSRELDNAKPSAIINSGGQGDFFDILSITPQNETLVTRVSGLTGEVYRTTHWSAPIPKLAFFRIVFLFHKDLLFGTVGHWLIGISGVFFFITACMGLYIGWPQKGLWKSVLKPKPFKWKQTGLYAWHRALGLWVSPVLLIVSLSGALMVWNIPLKELSGAIIKPPVIERAPDNQSPLSLNQAIKKALTLFPGALVAIVELPQDARPYYTIRLKQHAETRRIYGTTTVFVSSITGNILSIHDPLKAPLKFQTFDAFYSLHTGEIFGLAGRVVYQITGLLVISAICFGGLLWFYKNRRRRRKA